MHPAHAGHLRQLGVLIGVDQENGEGDLTALLAQAVAQGKRIRQVIARQNRAIRRLFHFEMTPQARQLLAGPCVLRSISRMQNGHAISHRIEPHALSDRIRGKLLFLLAWPTLLWAMRRRSRRTELWIGDSHAMCVNREVTNGMFMRAPDGQLILRAGARLMYSIARKGFPERVMRVARFVNRFGRPGALVPIFLAGEIDVRVHLPERPDAPFDWMAEYVERCAEVARLLKADRMGFF